MLKFNRDLINNASADHVSRAGIDIIDRMQNHPQHIQPVALAAAFLTIADHLRVPPQDLFTVTRNMMAEEENIAEFKALRDYVKYEIANA